MKSIPNPLDVLIEKINTEVAKIERERHEYVVETHLRREYQGEQITTTVEGQTYYRSRSYDEAAAMASDEIAAMTDEELAEKFDELYDDFCATANSSDWEDWDQQEGTLNGLNSAAGWTRELIEYGVFAFDPDHPRFKKEPDQ